MTTPLNWGVLGAAHIATSQVIPAMQQGGKHRVVAIASRDPAGGAAARSLGIARSYGCTKRSSMTEVEAIYNPLPNHLHVPWSIGRSKGQTRALRKTVAMNAGEARKLGSKHNDAPASWCARLSWFGRTRSG